MLNWDKEQSTRLSFFRPHWPQYIWGAVSTSVPMWLQTVVEERSREWSRGGQHWCHLPLAGPTQESAVGAEGRQYHLLYFSPQWDPLLHLDPVYYEMLLLFPPLSATGRIGNAMQGCSCLLFDLLNTRVSSDDTSGVRQWNPRMHVYVVAGEGEGVQTTEHASKTVSFWTTAYETMPLGWMPNDCITLWAVAPKACRLLGSCPKGMWPYQQSSKRHVTLSAIVPKACGPMSSRPKGMSPCWQSSKRHVALSAVVQKACRLVGSRLKGMWPFQQSAKRHIILLAVTPKACRPNVSCPKGMSPYRRSPPKNHLNSSRLKGSHLRSTPTATSSSPGMILRYNGQQCQPF